MSRAYAAAALAEAGHPQTRLTEDSNFQPRSPGDRSGPPSGPLPKAERRRYRLASSPVKRTAASRRQAGGPGRTRPRLRLPPRRAPSPPDTGRDRSTSTRACRRRSGGDRRPRRYKSQKAGQQICRNDWVQVVWRPPGNPSRASDSVQKCPGNRTAGAET